MNRKMILTIDQQQSLTNEQSKLISSSLPNEKAILIDILPPKYSKKDMSRDGELAYARTPQERMDEASSLAHSLGLEVTHNISLSLRKTEASTLIGKGKVQEIALLAKSSDIAICIINKTLSPIQQRNLERALGIKVMDRTGLILEIFGRRARTNEGKLQVDLARLEYDKSRLVRTWTHLERQRATGKTGGPGETQIELDRRLIANQIKSLKNDLTEVRRTRLIQREARKNNNMPTIALVGYTNSGKSTLFNKLTNAEIFAKDLLFATLDTTTRLLELPQGRQALISDTVGFINELPHELIEAFQATLEELNQADIILHVRDIASLESEAQKLDVETVLSSILGKDHQAPMIEVWNKMDRLGLEQKNELRERSDYKDPPVCLISAITGEGLDTLKALIGVKIEENNPEHDWQFEARQGKEIAFVYANGRVFERRDHNDGRVSLRARLNPGAENQLRAMLSKTNYL
jgi:GTPase